MLLLPLLFLNKTVTSFLKLEILGNIPTSLLTLLLPYNICRV